MGEATSHYPTHHLPHAFYREDGLYLNQVSTAFPDPFLFFTHLPLRGFFSFTIYEVRRCRMKEGVAFFFSPHILIEFSPIFDFFFDSSFLKPIAGELLVTYLLFAFFTTTPFFFFPFLDDE